MDLNNSISQNRTDDQEIKPNQPLIRTMRGDIERMTKGDTIAHPSKTLKPPENLPAISLQETAPSSPKPESFQPTSPIKPPIPPIPPPKTTEKPKERILQKNNLKFVLIIFTIFLVLLGIGGFFYWWNYIYIPPRLTHFECRNYQCVEIEGQGENQCSTDTNCLPKEPVRPDPLIPITADETIEISAEELKNTSAGSLLLEKIKAITEKEEPMAGLKRILVKLINGERKYASLAELTEMIGVQIPQEIKDGPNNYTLFVYQPENNEYDLCQEAGILNQNCFGPRLGLVVKNERTDIDTKQIAKEWEKTMVNDLRALILTDAVKIKDIGFENDQNINYQNMNIRYQNLPISPIAVNYAFFNDLLTICTSKHCLYKAIDGLMEK